MRSNHVCYCPNRTQSTVQVLRRFHKCNFEISEWVAYSFKEANVLQYGNSVFWLFEKLILPLIPSYVLLYEKLILPLIPFYVLLYEKLIFPLIPSYALLYEKL